MALTIPKKTREITGVTLDAIPYRELLDAKEPVILKGVLKGWPLVQKGNESAKSAMDYLTFFYTQKPVTVLVGEPEIGGRFFYNEDVTGRNFDASTTNLNEFLDVVHQQLKNPDAPAFYVGSTDVNSFLPGLRAENDLPLNDPMFMHNNPYVSIWIGNRTIAAAHYDVSNNMACCMVGKRRFTLFPPEQIHNLYPGPLEPTPGGQVVSMVDFDNPDYEKHPRFPEAVASAETAELEPGDLLLYPAMWWHQVEALSDFNVMINYWWNDVPAHIDDPQDTLLHAMLSLRDRPEQEKKAWREIFDYYIFGEADTAAKHLPEAAQGALGSIDAVNSRRLRAQILRRINR